MQALYELVKLITRMVTKCVIVNFVSSYDHEAASNDCHNQVFNYLKTITIGVMSLPDADV